MSGLKREKGNSGQRQHGNTRPVSFDSGLKPAAKTEGPEEVYLVTYTADKQLQTHYYRTSREYTF